MKSPIQRQVEALVKAHGGLRAASKAVGIDAGYLSRLRSGKRTNPTISTLALLGMRVKVSYHYYVPRGDDYEVAA